MQEKGAYHFDRDSSIEEQFCALMLLL